MHKTIEAVYEDGVLRPVQLLEGLQENQRVLLTVSTPPAPNPLAGWVGGLADEDAREMMRVIHSEFEQVDPNDWK
jgi:predicted DNA-binding antitoxin AbrB/MazE fold protein